MTKTVALGEICNIYKGKIGIQAAVPGQYTLVTTAEERASHDEFHFEGEAVCIPLVSATGHGHASIKRLHYENGKFCVGSILAACMPKDLTRTSAKFLYMYLSLFKDSLLVPLMQGSANVSLKIKDIQKVEVPDISIEEQRKIVDLIDKLKLKQDAILSEVYKQKSYLQLLRQTILQEAVQGKLTPQVETDEPASELLKRIKAEKQRLVREGKLKKEKELQPITEEEIPFKLPKGWVWCRLGNVVYAMNNGLYKPEAFYKPSGTISLRMFNIQDGRIDLSKVRRVILTAEEKALYKLSKNDILINRVNSVELVGKAAIIPELKEDLVYESMNMRVQLIYKDEIASYINLVLRTQFAKVYFTSNLKQAISQASINQTQVSNLLIPLPPVSEQRRIIGKVEKLNKYIDELQQQVANSQTKAQQLLQAVLKEAFEGKGKEYTGAMELTLAAEAL